MVESPRQTNCGGGRMIEFKTNGHELGAGAHGVVMVMVMFHKKDLLCLTSPIKLV